MKKTHRLKYILLLIIALLLATIAIFLWTGHTQAPGGATNTDDSSKTNDNKTNTKTTDDTKPEQKTFDKAKYSTTDPSSIWVVVNKKHALPSSFVPELEAVSGGQMRPAAGKALSSLLADSSSAGSSMYILSSYRSYSNQQSTYNGWVARDGVAQADTYSARPGHSEHQTGLAVDLGNGVCNLEICFGDTSAGKWLADNAYKYGFIVRYPADKTDITGYQYEPWHLRYVGTELAAEMRDKKITTLEEFFNISGGTSY